MDNKKLRQFSSSSANLFKGLFTIAVIAYVTYSVGLSIFNNYQTNLKISELKSEIEDIKQEIDELNNLIVYYQSDSFKELEARRRLGLRAKDEQIIILPKPEQRPIVEIKNSTEKVNASANRSNVLNWYQFIFGKK